MTQSHHPPPDWLALDVEVVLYTTRFGRLVAVQKSTVLRINKTSFTTTSGERFRFSDLRRPGDNLTTDRRAVQADSDTGRELFRRGARITAYNAACNAVAHWERGDSAETRAAVQRAMTELDEHST